MSQTNGPPRPTRVDLAGAAPIPVGTEVEVRFLQEPSALLSSPSSGVMVTELSTGIIHAPYWVYQEQGMVIEMTAPRLEPRADLVLNGLLRGRVTYCRIVTTRNKTQDQMTTLIVDPAPPAYR